MGAGQQGLRRPARRSPRRTQRRTGGSLMTDVVSTIWGFCHNLRHDGVDYGDYIEQITYLLFLKMADEQGVGLPAETDWPHLRGQSGVALVEHYEDALRTLGKQPAVLGDIFAGSQNRLANPA